MLYYVLANASYFGLVPQSEFVCNFASKSYYQRADIGSGAWKHPRDVVSRIGSRRVDLPCRHEVVTLTMRCGWIPEPTRGGKSQSQKPSGRRGSNMTQVLFLVDQPLLLPSVSISLRIKSFSDATVGRFLPITSNYRTRDLSIGTRSAWLDSRVSEVIPSSILLLEEYTQHLTK